MRLSPKRSPKTNAFFCFSLVGFRCHMYVAHHCGRSSCPLLVAVVGVS